MKRYLFIVLFLINSILSASEIKNQLTDNTFTIEDIYNKFNLRTVYSSFGQDLKYSCKNYLADYYKKDELVFSKDLIVIDNPIEFKSYSIEKNVLTIEEKIKSGTYNSRSIYILEYDKNKQNLTAIKEIKTSTFFPFNSTQNDLNIFIHSEANCNSEVIPDSTISTNNFKSIPEIIPNVNVNTKSDISTNNFKPIPEIIPNVNVNTKSKNNDYDSSTIELAIIFSLIIFFIYLDKRNTKKTKNNLKIKIKENDINKSYSKTENKKKDDISLEARKNTKEEDIVSEYKEKNLENTSKQTDNDRLQNGGQNKVSLNPIKWYKYTKLIVDAEKTFADVYNFDTTKEYKQYNKILILAFTVLFEAFRKEKVLPNEIEFIISALKKESPYYMYITPVGKDYVDFDAYRKIYDLYIEYRAKRERPFLAMYFTLQEAGEEFIIPDDEKDSLREDYNNSPWFGDTI